MKVLGNLIDFGKELIGMRRPISRPVSEDWFAVESEFIAGWTQLPDPPTISVVTPTFNSEAFLNQTIASVVGQPGCFFIKYHIQDGGSTDRTLEIVKNWQTLIQGDLPIGCLGIELTVTSEPDSGMYQAINRGFSKLPLSDSTLMTWINSDDILAPGSFATAVAVVQDVGLPWFGGCHALIEEHGFIVHVYTDNLFSREDLQRGLNAGRERPFIMQEGSFWRPWLWSKVGGLNENFRLAGDWDLWRRFAVHSPYFSVRTVLGFHRRREGQLSQDMGGYYAEVDATLNTIEIIETGLPDHKSLIIYNINSKKWEKIPFN